MIHKKNNLIWFIADIDYPEGRGGTSRIRNLAEGLLNQKYDTKVFIPHAAGYVHFQNSSSWNGIENGVYFEFLNKTVKRPETELLVVISKINGNIKLFLKYLFSNKPGTIIIYSYSLIDTGLLIFAAKLYRTKIIFDVCDERFDIHVHDREKSLFRKINSIHAMISDKVLFKMADGFFCVSTYLKEKINRFSMGKPILMIPLVSGKFPQSDLHFAAINNHKFAYVGSIIPDEGIEMLIDAICIVKKKYSNVTCSLYGDFNNKNYAVKIRQLVKDMDLDGSINFAGNVSHKDLIPILKTYYALVLPRPNSVISRAGFPGKIYEYLSSARPIISTQFGDMNLYFKDNVSAYLSNDYSAESFSQKIMEAINNNNLADKIGFEGYKNGKTHFDLNSVVKQIIDFIKV